MATLCLAHWPGHCSPWYDDLRRVARYGNLLGRFITAEDYFRDTDFPGHYETFQADQYQSPYLVESTECREIDPISMSVRYWRRHSLATAIQAAETMVTLVTERVPPEPSPAWRKGFDASADVPDRRIGTPLWGRRRGKRCGRWPSWSPVRPDRVDPGYLVVNPCSFVRRLPLDLPRLSSLPAIEPPVYAAADDGEHRYVVADVPPMGFTWIRGGPPAAPRPRGPAGRAISAAQ